MLYFQLLREMESVFKNINSATDEFANLPPVSLDVDSISERIQKLKVGFKNNFRTKQDFLS